jgi:hypothetical protein
MGMLIMSLTLKQSYNFYHIYFLFQQKFPHFFRVLLLKNIAIVRCFFFQVKQNVKYLCWNDNNMSRKFNEISCFNLNEQRDVKEHKYYERSEMSKQEATHKFNSMIRS